MGDSRRGRSGEGKHVKVVKQRSRNSSQYYSKTDMCPSQRKEERDVTSSDLDEPITNADVSANWYEDGEEEICASQALKTVQQQRSSSAKQTHTRPSSRGKKSSSHTPVSNRYSKRGSSSGYDSSSLPRYHKRSPSRGDGATTKEMASKYLGKKWPLSSAKPAQKRGGSMLSRKGDNHADMYGDLAFREMSASYDDLSDMGGSASYSENPLKKSAFPCKYFAMNRCTKGQQCPFSHTAEYTHPQNHYSIASTSYEDVPPGACLDWFYSGTCVNGPHCPMLHYIMGQDFDEYEEEEEEEEEEETARPVTVCSNWLQGRCRNGKACNFKHMTTTDETDEADKPDLLNMVKQGAGKIASTVTAPIQALREKVNSLRDELAEDQKHLLTRTLQMVLGRLSEGERDTLLGLPQAVLGLTRFRSVLIKRTIKYAFDACDLEAIESLSRWEDELELHMPEPPYDETFSKFFEKNLCQHYVEIVRCMLASPLCRLRSDWLLQAVRISTSPDPLHDVIKKWLVTDENTQPVYSIEGHHDFPCTLRQRARSFLWSMQYQCEQLKRFRSLYGFMIPAEGEKNSLFENVIQFMEPVEMDDIPLVERDAGTHVFLDTLAAVLVNYNLCIIGAPDKDESREKLGETIWPHVIAQVGESLAPQITGMLLTMEPDRLLLEAVNPVRLKETITEAADVLENGE